MTGFTTKWLGREGWNRCCREAWILQMRSGIACVFEADHELRAALICLLTAALAEKGTAAIICETEGGWFWLPPWSGEAFRGTLNSQSRASQDVRSFTPRDLP